MDEIKVKLNYDPSKSTSYSDLIKANAELVKALREAADDLKEDGCIDYGGYLAIADKYEVK